MPLIKRISSFLIDYMSEDCLFWLVGAVKCAGNRRTAMSKIRKVRGVGWDISAIGNGLLLNCRLNVLATYIMIHVTSIL